MKQYITEKQWNELNKKQQKKYKENTTYGLFIGGMIEFLGDDIQNIERVFGKWCVDTEDIHCKKELCDALWEAVKYKLKQ